MKTVLIIGHTYPEPNTTAAGTRMMQLIEFFQGMGLKVVFGSTASPTAFSEVLEELEVVTISLELNSSTFDVKLKEILPDIVLYDRFMTEEQFGWRVREHCQEALTILDTEDLHFLRKAREEAFKKQQPLNLYTEETKRELASILRCDLSLIISEVEFQLLTDTFSISPEKLCYLPLIYQHPVKSSQPPFEEREHFVILGNFMHAPNRDAIRWLKQSIWAQIKKQLPNAECHVYGAYIPKEIQTFQDKDEGFLIKGWAEDKESVITHAKVMVAPLRFGAGLKGKVLDGLALGTPVVTTPIGLEGINGSYTYSGGCQPDAVDVATTAVALYSDSDLWMEAQKQGFEIIQKRFLKTNFVGAFSNRITEVMEKLPEYRQRHFIGEILQHESLQSKKYLSKWIEWKNKS